MRHRAELSQSGLGHSCEVIQKAQACGNDVRHMSRSCISRSFVRIPARVCGTGTEQHLPPPYKQRGPGGQRSPGD